jgi:hypothetical protein
MRTLFVTVAVLLTAPAVAAAAPRITVSPATVDHDAVQTVKGRGWPVIEFCKRTVRIRLVSDQNLVTLGRRRVSDNGRFTFRWTPDDENVGAPSSWRLVVRMMCESGEDGSPNPVRVSKRIRVRA